MVKRLLAFLNRACSSIKARLTKSSSTVDTRRGIELQTREGWDIPNSQSTDFSMEDERHDANLRQKYSRTGAVEFRTGIIPIYNCHGLTFGSRRTQIGEGYVIRRILSDDKYVRIKHQEVLSGDVVIYVGEDGDIEHSAVVLEKPDQQLKIPRVLSKWGTGAEASHWANQCPYSFQSPEYYRIVK